MEIKQQVKMDVVIDIDKHNDKLMNFVDMLLDKLIPTVDKSFRKKDSHTLENVTAAINAITDKDVADLGVKIAGHLVQTIILSVISARIEEGAVLEQIIAQFWVGLAMKIKSRYYPAFVKLKPLLDKIESDLELQYAEYQLKMQAAIVVPGSDTETKH